ncbi:MAG: hypothetical protein JO243_05195 [Solirubrobacterales bacterium]|nr:hypothetical protein [Solirubrobacterales bacterium]
METDGPSIDLDLLAASLRIDSADSGTFVESLAVKLADILPGRVAVKHARRGMLGPKYVRLLSVQVADQRLELMRSDRDVVQARRGRLSGGIVLKTEPLEVDEWLGALGSALAGEAKRNETTRQALERLMIEGH